MRQALQSVRRRPATPQASRNSTWTRDYGAPVRGWVTNNSLATPIPQSALVLDNFIPTSTGAQVRGGTALHATLPDAVTSMFTYDAGGVSKSFAADANGIYDTTSPGDPAVALTAAVGSQTSGYWTFTQFGTTGGEYIIGCNGTDTPQKFDGSTWSTVSVTGPTPSDLSFVWQFKNRLFFIESGTKSAWYLSVDTIGGSLTKFSLASIFEDGGDLMIGGSWSYDAGDGMGDRCVFISTLGEVAVYQGSSALDWSIVGRYKMPAPLGKNAWMKAGGDIIVATVEGMVPMSGVVSKDPAALSLAAVSRAVEPDWKTEVSARGTKPWDVTRWDELNLAMVSMPSPGSTVDNIVFIVNVETGAWSRFTGWDCQCATVSNAQLYWGDSDGLIYAAETGGSDNGSIYTCTYVAPFEAVGDAVMLKSITLAKAWFRARRNFEPKLSVSQDYGITLPVAPDSVADGATDTWDSGVWDTAVWDSGNAYSLTTEWVSIAGFGDVFAAQVQITFGVSFKPDAELIKMRLVGENGRMVA